MNLSKIAEKIGGEFNGPDVEITGVSDLESQNENTIAYAENKKNLELLALSQVAAIITLKGMEVNEKPYITVDNPKIAFSKVLEIFSPYKKYKNQVYPNVYIEKSAKIGENVSVLPFTNIMDNAEIGEGTTIYSQVFIGKNVKIGNGCLIKAGVKIDDETEIGDRVIIHHNAVIGGDGFSYIQKDGENIKISHIGKIIIGDDVEIGACVTVDRAMIGATVISKGVKVDNLVQIAHNVKIGENTIVISQTGIAGSSTIGKNCILTGQVGIADHAKIGNNVVVLAQSGVDSKPVEDNKILFGSPARDFMEQKRIHFSLAKLPELIKTVQKIKKKLGIDE